MLKNWPIFKRICKERGYTIKAFGDFAFKNQLGGKLRLKESQHGRILIETISAKGWNSSTEWISLEETVK
jgi:hypothetical protein